MILEEHVFNKNYSPDWQEKIFLPSPNLRNIKMALNFLISKIQFRLRMTKLLNYPHFALVDPSSVCNLHCPLCPTGQGDKSRSKCLMKFEDFKKVIDQIGDYLISVLFTNWGEPFLNRDFIKMLKYSKEIKQIPFLSVDTNLNINFSDQDIEDLVNSGLDLMCISIDGTTQESYSKYRRGGSLEKVIENSKKILKKKKELKKDRPFLIWQFLVLKHNENEVEKIIEMGRDVGVDAVRISAAQVYMSEVDKPFEHSYKISKAHLPPLGSKYSGYTKDGERKSPIDICHWLWKGIVINSDGGVSPCCAIFPDKYDFGNVLKGNGFKSIWNNEKYREARKAVKDLKYAKKSFKDRDNICLTCTAFGNWTG